MENYNYQKEEKFLQVVANAYISLCPDELLAMVPDDFGFDTMWRYEYQITNKELYKRYIMDKFAVLKRRMRCSEFAMMKDKRDGKPLLLITNSRNPDGGQAVFVVKSDKDGNIKRLDITAADFFPMEPMSVNNIFKRTYQTLLDTQKPCWLKFKTTKGETAEYKGVIADIRSLESAWGLACIDEIPDDFCMVYNNINYLDEIGMFTEDTRFAVDFVFVDKDNTIIKIHKNMPPLSTETVYCSGAKLVIEMKAGQCDKNNIELNDSLELIG